MNIEHTLKQYFGHETFRAGQRELIEALTEGRDALGVMPTGAGKSVCYQLPALVLPGITLVISPLISLMKDQVAALRLMGVDAAYINSSLSPAQSQEALRRAAMGRYKIIYVAPERLDVPEFLDFATGAPVSMLTVDEAHCISQWGQDFRPSYLKINDFLERLPQRPIVSAFTATATPQVKKDIQGRLELKNPLVLTTGFDRPNLYFENRKPKHKLSALLEFLDARSGKSGIVYCATRKAVEEVADKLVQAGHPATRYHAGLSDRERAENQDDFQYDRKPIMVATNAFGMGIDKSNVSFVVHYNMPKNLESYYQEAGRAGRDGEHADCLLLYGGQDVFTARFLIEHSEDNPELSDHERAVVRARDLERLKQMTFYSTSKRCLRRFMMRYFGDDAPERCGNCSVCLGLQFEMDNAPAPKRAKAPADVPQDDPLYLALVDLRSQLARRMRVPAYVIFSNATLRDMAARRPLTRAKFLEVSGVGEAKLKQYGDAFLGVIQVHVDQFG